jgi:hypothetical protein
MKHGQDARATPLRLRVKRPEPPKPFAFYVFFAAITVVMPSQKKSAASAKSADQKNRALPETKER